jgi:hypothetical protein
VDSVNDGAVIVAIVSMPTTGARLWSIVGLSAFPPHATASMREADVTNVTIILVMGGFTPFL